MKPGMNAQNRARRPASGFLFAVLFIAFAAQAAFASDDARRLFDEAIRLRAAELSTSSALPVAGAPPAADAQPTSGSRSGDTSRELFAKSADLFEAEAARDWRLWYEAGNARWWAGDADKAIANYRRYIAHDYFRAEAWENLAEARRSAQTENPGDEGFLAWPWPLWFLSAAALVAGFAALAFSIYLFLKKASSGKKAWLHASAALASVALAFVLASLIAWAARGNVAVIAKETAGRKGDSSVYAVWPAAPWKAGQEVFIAETRDTWTRIRVGNTVSWVPSDCLIMVDGS